MYLVVEIQKSDLTTLSHIVTVHNTLNDADSKFHQVLSYAAVSELPLHGAVILSENGNTIRTQTYKHEVSDQQ